MTPTWENETTKYRTTCYLRCVFFRQGLNRVDILISTYYFPTYYLLDIPQVVFWHYRCSVNSLLVRFLNMSPVIVCSCQEKFKDVVHWLRQNKAGPAVVSSPSAPNDGKTTLPSTVDSKFMEQQGSDNGQKGPITAASSSPFQISSSQNMFSFSQQKTPAFSGITIHLFICNICVRQLRFFLQTY